MKSPAKSKNKQNKQAKPSETKINGSVSVEWLCSYIIT